MKRLLIIIVLFMLMTDQAHTQTVYFTKQAIGQKLHLRTHKDSIKNIYPITYGQVIINRDTINLKSLFPYRAHSIMNYYKNNMALYYLDLKSQRDSLCVELTFCMGYLIDIDILTKGHYNINNLKIELEKRYPYNKINKEYSIQRDSVVKYADRIVTYGEHYSQERWYYKNAKINLYFQEDLKLAQGYLNISD